MQMKEIQKNKWEQIFLFKKRINQMKKKDYELGEKGIVFEPFQSRIYPREFISHLIGQVDYDNYGISGLEKHFDRELRNNNQLKPLKLTLDTNIQYLINKELNSLDTFNATGGGAILMDVNNGEILSLVSLPDFNLIMKITEKKIFKQNNKRGTN